MAVVSKSALVPYTAAEMFSLVNDIESYPEFLPWCSAAQIHQRNEDEIHASISIARGAYVSSHLRSPRAGSTAAEGAVPRSTCSIRANQYARDRDARFGRSSASQRM